MSEVPAPPGRLAAVATVGADGREVGDGGRTAEGGKGLDDIPADLLLAHVDPLLSDLDRANVLVSHKGARAFLAPIAVWHARNIISDMFGALGEMRTGGYVGYFVTAPDGAVLHFELARNEEETQVQLTYGAYTPLMPDPELRVMTSNIQDMRQVVKLIKGLCGLRDVVYSLQEFVRESIDCRAPFSWFSTKPGQVGYFESKYVGIA